MDAGPLETAPSKKEQMKCDFCHRFHHVECVDEIKEKLGITTEGYECELCRQGKKNLELYGDLGTLLCIPIQG